MVGSFSTAGQAMKSKRDAPRFFSRGRQVYTSFIIRGFRVEMVRGIVYEPDRFLHLAERHNQRSGKMIKADCPSCNGKVNLGAKPKLGQRVVCPTCNAELEVVWLDPVELDFPYDDDEFDDYDEEDYEEAY
jgi:lysine biosynthesis protein LysW